MKNIKHHFREIMLFQLLIWLGLLFYINPLLTHDEWARAILYLGVLVLIPIGFYLLSGLGYAYVPPFWLFIFPSTWLFIGSFLLENGILAGLMCLPYLGITVYSFLQSSTGLFPNIEAKRIALSAAQLFLIIGAIAAFLDRMDLQPLDFGKDIILLTAVHFHYAGFIFPLLCGLIAWHYPNIFAKTACILSFIAIPLTALGITLYQVSHFYFIEMLNGIIVALAGWSCAIAYLGFIFSKKINKAPQILWLITSFSLIFSMSLAFLYAIRFVYPIDWIQIPYMRAFHGTANAFGVGVCGLLGWLRFQSITI